MWTRAAVLAIILTGGILGPSWAAANMRGHYPCNRVFDASSVSQSKTCFCMSNDIRIENIPIINYGIQSDIIRAAYKRLITTFCKRIGISRDEFTRAYQCPYMSISHSISYARINLEPRHLLDVCSNFFPFAIRTYVLRRTTTIVLPFHKKCQSVLDLHPLDHRNSS